MDIAIYIALVLLILLIVLAVHEGGHLITAKALGVRVAAFRIGIGPKIFGFYTGATCVTIPQHLPLPAVGEKINISVNQASDRRLTATFWSKTPSFRQFMRNRKNGPPPQPPPENDFTLHGKVRKACPETRTVTLADMTWSIALIPFMAMVELPEAGRAEIKDCYNTTSWLNQTAITLAGVGANFILLFLAITTLAIMPPSGIDLLTAQLVQPGSEEHRAGLRDGDSITAAGRFMLPDYDDLAMAQQEATRRGRLLTITAVEQATGQEKRVVVDPEIAFKRTILAMQPQNAGESGRIDSRFQSLTAAYFGTIPVTAQELRPGQKAQDNGQPALTGLVSTSYFTGKAIQRGKLRAWVAVLGAISMMTAFLNLVPFPPLDGYKLVIHTAEALRGSNFSPAAKFKIDLAGFSIIIGLGIYLAVKDIVSMTF